MCSCWIFSSVEVRQCFWRSRVCLKMFKLLDKIKVKEKQLIFCLEEERIVKSRQ